MWPRATETEMSAGKDFNFLMSAERVTQIVEMHRIACEDTSRSLKGHPSRQPKTILCIKFKCCLVVMLELVPHSLVVTDIFGLVAFQSRQGFLHIFVIKVL